MCFNVSITKKADQLEELFNAKFVEPERFQPIYHVSAFSKPHLPVISNDQPDNIRFFQWGLIPYWTKDQEKAEKIRFQTGNARAETIFDKPSFRMPIHKRRYLILIDGLYEWQEFRGKKYPHYIHLTDKRPFALAGIWDHWSNPSHEMKDDKTITFSVITTTANPMMERIHNTKKRMPVILKKEDESTWLDDSLGNKDISELLRPYDDSEMKAHTVSKLISWKGVENNVPKAQKHFSYPELHTRDLFSY